MLIPDEQRRFAEEVVRRLQAAGFEAYWAGGCVRDQLLGRTPKDYDVATSATPAEIRQVFGRRRTVAIGAAFGVISVVGPKAAGTVEVTTFRRDAAYSDGRHPDHVTFSTAQEDASRRDFTINGLFYEPAAGRVIDFVGGQVDLAARQIRAIGNASDRFAEDKLRMLRAVRFAATLGFAIDADSRAAIRAMAAEIHVVSPERIAAEMRRMLADPGRAAGVKLLLESGLAAEVLPEIAPRDQSGPRPAEQMIEELSRLPAEASFPLALSIALCRYVDASGADAVCQRWRLSNKERQRVAGLVGRHVALEEATTMPWSKLQPLLIAEGIDELLTLLEARLTADAAAHCRRLLLQPREVLDPPALLDGNDLLAHGVASGPRYARLLQRARAAQLDGEVHNRQEALAMVEKWLAELGTR